MGGLNWWDSRTKCKIYIKKLNGLDDNWVYGAVGSALIRTSQEFNKMDGINWKYRGHKRILFATLFIRSLSVINISACPVS